MSTKADSLSDNRGSSSEDCVSSSEVCIGSEKVSKDWQSITPATAVTASVKNHEETKEQPASTGDAERPSSSGDGRARSRSRSRSGPPPHSGSDSATSSPSTSDSVSKSRPSSSRCSTLLATEDVPETCNLCNEELCPQCDPDTDHVCGMYMEAARKRNGNALRGNEYMSMIRWTFQCARNVLVPWNFFRDLRIGTEGRWDGRRWVLLRWGLWCVAVLLLVPVWPAMLVYSCFIWLLEDSVWREE